jgi:hypothetical protein
MLEYIPAIPSNDPTSVGAPAGSDHNRTQGFDMADSEVRFIRDCVNPAMAVEKTDADGDVLALHITGKHTLISAPPPAVVIDGVRYEPVT